MENPELLLLDEPMNGLDKHGVAEMRELFKKLADEGRTIIMANHSAEDEKDLSKVNLDLGLYEVFTRGFLQGADGILTEAELEYLPWGARLMTLECGIRFLTDYLDGDHYFAVHRDGQNLDRARTQFKLVADMEKKWDEMRKIVEEEAK